MRAAALTTVLALIAGSTALAAGPAERFRVDPELAERYRRFEAAKRGPAPQLQVDPIASEAAPLTVEGEVIDVLDGTMLVAVPLSPEQLDQLSILPYRVVFDRASVEHQTIYAQRLYLRFSLGELAATADGEADSEVGPFDEYVGQQVVLQLRRTPKQGTVIVEVERKE